MQSARLRGEGVPVDNGRVRGLRAAPTPEEALDAEVWGVPPAAARATGRSAGAAKTKRTRR